MQMAVNQALGVDIALSGTSQWTDSSGDISVSTTNDLQTVDDITVVRQALIKRLNTRRGVLWAHPKYGCEIWDILSELMSDTWYRQAVATVTECINDDPRTQVVSVVYEGVPQERRVTFTITYQILSDGRQDNLVWTYAPEAVTDSV